LRRKERELQEAEACEEKYEFEIVQFNSVVVDEKAEEVSQISEAHEIKAEIQFESSRKDVGCSLCSVVSTRCVIF
jgi:hypothetical protein